MEYYPLKKILYKYDHHTYEREYLKRIDSYSTIKFPLYISNLEVQLFCVIDIDMIYKIDLIQKRMNDLSILQNQERNAYYYHYTYKLFIDELVATNEIEGVHTTRKDIASVYGEKNQEKKKLMRHSHLVGKYQKLINNEEINIKSLEDVRIIYDELLTKEVDDSDLPDGKLFRAKEVFVNQRSNVEKTVHVGVNGESNINVYLKHLLNYLNDSSTKEPMIIKIAIIHYYFCYIHPFYDGNGRMSRFISSYLLSKYEHELLSFKLSKIIKENIKQYDDAFILTNDIVNRGDATLFVKMFIDVIDKSSLEIYDELTVVENKIYKFNKVFDNNKIFNSKDQFKILEIIYNGYLCDRSLYVQIISENVNLSKTTTLNKIKELDKIGLVSYQQRKPIKLTDKFFNLLEE